jgi:predicted nucleic-acid-binding Zn-ribbon protein
MAVPTCIKCGAKEFTHQDKEFGGLMTRIVFCSNCGAVIGVVIAI